MHSQLARHFSNELGLSFSPPPAELREVTVSLWHASHDRDPAHLWLRQTVDLARNPNKAFDARARRPCRCVKPRPFVAGSKTAADNRAARSIRR